jgi:hypothetical protein
MALTAITNPRTAAASDGDSLLDFSEASEIRNDRGERRFGSMYTIRRRVKDGKLPHERVGIKYFVRLSALEALERVKVSTDRGTAAIAELEIAANRVLAFSGPLSDEQCDRIAARLKGAA